MIDVGGGYLNIPAVENGGFQDDRCSFKHISKLMGNRQFMVVVSVFT